ncbi:MAG: hypothetical protein Q7R67_00205 [bacterium]|nr:hypothetical protein [bacterium]
MILCLCFLSVALVAAQEPAQQPVFPALTEPAYVGVGQVDLKKISLRSARDLGIIRAQGALARAICDPNNEKERVRAFIVGKRHTDELRVGDVLWVRIWIRKDEVEVDKVCLD